MKKLIQKSNGSKTPSVAIAFLALKLIMRLKPDLIDLETEEAIEVVIAFLFSGSLGHKLTRNWKLIRDYAKRKLKRLK